ncbi:protein kinase [Actinocrinis puniceicyclus]|uniref:non-specific serine/threonine protein kinase n=1 Tax=Actinocrinis puniceicyclus TaxID=977794 RepID=A0A8J7WLL8_9ACTN|nr:serine/threonine-protein kinase [Actinocrinis puniceicyclus]MBS2964616.1 protein kinase [Actinocrinis puniceicyclus]
MTETADLIAGRYRLIAQIGKGGMGVVWQARDELLGRTVALKELPLRSAVSAMQSDDGARRAMREARIAARLHHPNVIGIYDVVDHDNRPFLVMEFMAARSLSQMLAAEELLAPREAARVGAQLAAALTAAHEAGIVHRDVKPGNVLLGDGAVKLTDFGISRAVGDTTVTASGVLLGTLGYIAPEVAQGQPSDARSDVYSLGATLYAAVEGQPPFGTDDNAVALLYRIVHEEIIPARRAGPLEPVLMWMLERDPALRPTMPQVQRALEQVETEPDAVLPAQSLEPTKPVEQPVAEPADDHTPGLVGQPEPGDSGTRPSRRARRVLAAALIVAVLSAVGAVLLARQFGGGASGSGVKASGTTPAASRRPSASATRPTESPSHASQGSTPPASRTPAPSPAGSQPLEAQLVSTIVDYYRLMPGNLNQGWTWMTADYQTNHAGGRDGYDSFWSQIQRVSVSAVTAQAPSSVEATIDYYYKDGTVIEERTRFGLVLQQGRWLIAGSSVLSHRSL